MSKLNRVEPLETRALLSLPADDYDYLSDLTPTLALNGWGEVERDLSNGGNRVADGRQIKINGARYTKGLGMHANAEVHYELNGRYRNFISDVGVDDEVGRVGSATFQIFADGEKMFDSGVLTGMDSAKRVNIDVTGKREMILIVNDGGDDTGYDHVDWAGARLVRPSGDAPIVNRPADIEVRESFPLLSLSSAFTDTTEGPWVATVDYGDGSGRDRLELNEDKSFDLEHVYDARSDGDYTVTVRVGNQFATGVSTFRVAVRNETPRSVGLVGGDATGTLKALAGFSIATNGIFTDAGTFGGAQYSATMDYGDGSPIVNAGVSGRFFSSTHVYRKSGTYTVTSTVTDAGGKSGVGTNTIVVADPQFTHLADLTPSNGGAFVADRAADGSNLKINGTRYTRGLGVTANSDLRYALDGNYSNLVADVGVDDKVGVNGSVIFQVFGDGVMLFQSNPMTGRDGAKRLNVNVRGVTELQLVVTHAGAGGANSLDRADWAGIRLV